MCDKTCKCQESKKRSRRFELWGERQIAGSWQTLPIGHGVQFPDGSGAYRYVDPAGKHSTSTLFIEDVAKWQKGFVTRDLVWLD